MTRQIANAAGLPVLDMALSPDVHDPLAYATQLTPEQRQQRIVVCVRGLDNLLPLHENGQPTRPERWPEVQTQVARTLDLRRDWLGHMPHVFLVWANLPMLGVLREFAPNFMSQARGVFDLRDLDDTQTQLPERSLERLPHGEVSVPDADTLRREWALVTEQLAALKGENIPPDLALRVLRLQTDAQRMGVALADPPDVARVIDALRADPAATLAQGNRFYELDQVNDAVELYTRALEGYRTKKDHRGESIA